MRAAWAALLVLAVLGGCRPPFESRFDVVPGPMTTADLALAAADEPVPLTPEEWAAADAAMDAYLRAFEDLRTNTIAPFVRQARQDQSNRWLADDAALSHISRRALTLLERIASQDDALCAALGALPGRADLAERVRTRRAMQRALAVTAGHDEDGAGEGFLDLDLELTALLARPACADRAVELRAALEPQRAGYRTQLSALATALAEALLEFPGDRLKALRAAGVGDAEIEAYVRGGSTQGTPEQQRAIATAVRQSQARINRLVVSIDDLNARTATAWSAALPPDAAELLASEAVFRSAQPDSLQPVMRWYVEVLEVLPEVREGRAPRTAAAVTALRKATEQYAVAMQKRWRSTIELPGKPASVSPDARPKEQDAELHAATERVRMAVESATKVSEEELKQETRDQLQALMRAGSQDARAALDTLVGPRHAGRLMARAPRSMFRVKEEEESTGKGDSMALQILLGPMMSRDQFQRIAAALGAPRADAVTEELWTRYRERADALVATQDAELRDREKEARQRGQNAAEDEGAFEREVAQYLAALMDADEARGRAMNEAILDLAAAHAVPTDDPRVTLATAELAIARSAVAWRRFQLPWLVGPLWLSQADLPTLIAQVAPPEPEAQAQAVAVAARHANAIQEAALASRMAGFNGLRDFLIQVIRLQKQGARERIAPDEIPRLPVMQTLARRIRDAAIARMDAQVALMDALEPVLGAERAAALRLSYAQQTMPEFFAENPWYADARALALSALDARAGAGTQAQAIAAPAERWRTADADLVQRLIQWERSPTAVPPPMRAQDLGILALEDGELSSLRALRDEHSLRLLRDAALAAGQPAHARMATVQRTSSRPPVRFSE